MTDLQATRAVSLLNLISDHPDYAKEVLFLVRAAWKAKPPKAPLPEKAEEAKTNKDADLLGRLKEIYTLKQICAELKISPSTYYAAKSGEKALSSAIRQAAEAFLVK